MFLAGLPGPAADPAGRRRDRRAARCSPRSRPSYAIAQDASASGSTDAPGWYATLTTCRTRWPWRDAVGRASHPDPLPPLGRRARWSARPARTAWCSGREVVSGRRRGPPPRTYRVSEILELQPLREVRTRRRLPAGRLLAVPIWTNSRAAGSKAPRADQVDRARPRRLPDLLGHAAARAAQEASWRATRVGHHDHPDRGGGTRPRHYAPDRGRCRRPSPGSARSARRCGA
jgi:hypothetical protein